MNVEERLRTERIGKLLLTFSVPSIISLVITAVYNMVDQIFIGQGVGYLGNGATNSGVGSAGGGGAGDQPCAGQQRKHDGYSSGERGDSDPAGG